MASSPTSNQKKEECVSKVVESFHLISVQNQDLQLQNLTAISRLHDNVIGTLSNYAADASTSRIQNYILRLRLHQTDEDAAHIQRFIPLEADLYRSVSLTSLYLLHTIPLISPIPDEVRKSLEGTLKKTQLLLKILEKVTVQCYENEEGGDTLLPTNHPFLDEWILKFRPKEEDTGVEISLDREGLQMEEDELLQMATTPTPYENNPLFARKDQISFADPIARLLLVDNTATDSSAISTHASIAISLNTKGVFRPRDTSSFDLKHSWWLITCDSTVLYESPILTIYSVLTNHYTSSQKISCKAIKVNVGKDGTLWWEKISRIVQELKQIKELQDEVRTLWPDPEFKSQLKLSRAQTCLDSTALI
jgi:hypothetical protein